MRSVQVSLAKLMLQIENKVPLVDLGKAISWVDKNHDGAWSKMLTQVEAISFLSEDDAIELLSEKTNYFCDLYLSRSAE